MGKRYKCDYCDKTMVSAPSIIKTHNKGLVHQKLVQEHYLQYKDPETILREEQSKKPCSRFEKGTCMFGALCRFSHYTRQDMEAIRQLVESKKSQTEVQQPSFEDLYADYVKTQKSKLLEKGHETTTIIDKNGVTHELPWTYCAALDTYENIPPSIKRIKIEDFATVELSIWG